MPTAISQYVLKVHSRCDLSCDHCYVYEHADQSWRVKPRAIDEATVRQAARRISEHARSHRLDQVHVVLHGGEPLLLGYDGLRGVLDLLRSLINPVTELDLRIHTNGVLLDERLCALFAEYAVTVGVSLDGDRIANDRHRRFSDGRSSHAQVLSALALLRKPEYRSLYAGLLCTVELDNDPISVYEALLAEAPPRLDLLLPHATWDHPPPRPADADAPYAAWLGQIHARWVSDGRPVPIRLFDSVLAAWQGRRSGTEAAGLDPVDLLVIETDGSWEQADSLKTAFDRAPETGFNVFSHSVDAAAAHAGVAQRQEGLAALCAQCRACPVVRACGGGLYAHRYKSGRGFDNPSVYCADLKALIPRIAARPASAPVSAAPAGRSAFGHILSDKAFDLLSAGPGDSSAMTALAEAQWSMTRALVAAVAADLDRTGGDLGRAAAEGWRLLSALDTERPRAVREVLTYPFVQVWAAQCLRAAKSADADRDRAHLAGLAAAAALRAGIEAELALPVREGYVYLPGVGALDVGRDADTVLAVRVSPAGLSVRGGETHKWRAVRRVTAAGMSVAVEDIDPFRGCQAWAATGRLPATTWQAWRLALTGAARQLAAELPAYAAVIGAGLRSVVPIVPRSPGSDQSGTARHAFGAVGLALPADAAALGALLLHETQHVKLAALADLIDLFDQEDVRRFPVPWRVDRRPVEGVLHGTYAHLAIAELWRSRAARTSKGSAPDRFRVYRSWVEEGIETLLASDALTPAGDRFVNGMRETAGAWADDW
jgi:uncharacterized protein